MEAAQDSNKRKRGEEKEEEAGKVAAAVAAASEEVGAQQPAAKKRKAAKEAPEQVRDSRDNQPPLLSLQVTPLLRLAAVAGLMEAAAPLSMATLHCTNPIKREPATDEEGASPPRLGPGSPAPRPRITDSMEDFVLPPFYMETAVGGQRGEEREGHTPNPPPLKTGHKLSAAETAVLERAYLSEAYPGRDTYAALATEIGVARKTIKNWFGRRRKKTRDQEVRRAKEKEKEKAAQAQAINPLLLKKTTAAAYSVPGSGKGEGQVREEGHFLGPLKEKQTNKEYRRFFSSSIHVESSDYGQVFHSVISRPRRM